MDGIFRAAFMMMMTALTNRIFFIVDRGIKELTVQLRHSVVALDGALGLLLQYQLHWRYLRSKVGLGDWMFPAATQYQIRKVIVGHHFFRMAKLFLSIIYL